MKLSIEYKQPRVEVGFAAPSLGVSTGTPVARDYVERPAYDGPTEVTPSSVEQILLTKNLRMTENIKVNPVPSNYGLITWDGSTITVS